MPKNVRNIDDSQERHKQDDLSAIEAHFLICHC